MGAIIQRMRNQDKYPTRLPAHERAALLAPARRERLGEMLVLHLAGKPYALGLQHGVLARAEILRFRRDAYRYLGGEVARLLGLPRALARLIARPLLLAQARAFVPFIPQQYLEEMRGLADGVGVPLLEAVLINVIWELYLGSGCSEFAVRGRRTADGALLHGYNYDLLDPAQAFINPYLALICYRPAGGAPFAQLNMLGSVGVNAGMSARGISVAWDNTIARAGATLLRGAPRRCTPFVIALRDLLEHADSIDAAVATLRRHLPRPTADSIIVGEAAGNRAVALETIGSTLAAREMHDDAVWSANSFVSPITAPDDRPGPPGGRPGESGNSQGRYSAYAELLAQPRPLGVADAVAILRDPYPRERYGYIQPPERLRTICRPITSFSMVMQPASGRMWLAEPRVPASQGRFLGFGLESMAALAEPPVPASGMAAAARAYRHYAGGWHAEALAALEQALALDGASAPLHLMLAQVYRALRQPERAAEQAALARAAGARPGQRMPFPSAIDPLAYLEVEP